MSLEQGSKISLREYLNRFTKEDLKVSDLDDKVAMITLQQGTKNEYFKMLLAKGAAENMLQLQERAEKYIKAEKAMKKDLIPPEGRRITRKEKGFKCMMQKKSTGKQTKI